MEALPVYLALFAILLASLSVHEAAHAWAADRLGDPTARLLGRLTLNPVAHIDPIGTLLLPALAIATGAPVIGWAKPVPVNLARLARGRRDFVLVAAAGPGSNLVLASLAALCLAAFEAPLAELPVLASALGVSLRLNLLLAVFNMLPFPPLDGGNVLGGLLPARAAAALAQVQPYGMLILFALMLTGLLGVLIGPPYAFLLRLLT